MKTAIASLMLLVVLRPEIQERTDAADDIPALLARKIHFQEAGETYSVELSAREATLLRDRMRAMRFHDLADGLQCDIDSCANKLGGLYMSRATAKAYHSLITGN